MPNVLVTSLPQDVSTLPFSATDETMLTIGAGGGLLAVIDTAESDAVVFQEFVSGNVASGLVPLAPDGSGGTTLSFAADAALSFGIGHTILADLVGQPASAYEDADAAGEFLGLGSTPTTIAGTLVLGGGAAITSTGPVTQTGTLRIGDGPGTAARLTNEGVYVLTGDVGIAIGTAAGSTFDNDGGTLEKTAGAGISRIAAGLGNSGGAAASIVVASGTLEFDGATNSFVAEAVTGAGTFAIGGGASTIGAGTSILSRAFAIRGAGTGVTLGVTLSYGGSFSQGAGSVLTLAGGYLLLRGTASFSGATVNGSQRLYAEGATTIAGLTIGGTAVFEDTASVTQSGGKVTVGDGGAQAAVLFNYTGATYAIADDSGIGHGLSAASYILNDGLFEKIGGVATSTIAASFVGTGAVAVAAGSLAFTGPSNSFAGAISGGGSVVLGGSTTLRAGTTATVAALSIAGAGASVTLAESLGYDGAFTQGAGTALAISSGDTLTLSGTTDLCGRVTSAGTLALAGGGTTTIATGAALSVGALTLSGAGTAATLGGNLVYGGTFAEGPGTTLTLGGGYLLLSGGASFAGATVDGSQRLYTQGTTAIAGLVIGGTVVLQNTGTMTQSGGTVTLGDGSGSAAVLFNAPTGTYVISDASGVARGTSAASTILNQGLFEKTSTSGVSVLAASMVDTGTMACAGGNLVFDGPNNRLSGTYIGPGMFDYGPDGTATLGAIAMTSGACSTDLGTVNQRGVVTVADGTTIRTFAGAHWNIVGDVGLALAAGSSDPLFTNWGTLAKTGGTGTSTVATNVTDTGLVTVASGTLAFTGASDSFAGAIRGAGTVAFGGGSVLSAGASLGVARLAVSGVGAVLSVATNLTYGGAFTEAAGSVLSLTGGYLLLSGTASLAGTVNGSQRLYAEGTSTTIAGLTIGGTAILETTKAVTQAGSTVTVGDTTSSAAVLYTYGGSVYSIADDSSIARGTAAGSYILDQGTLQKTGGTGTSTIAPNIVNNTSAAGTVGVTSGTLDLGGTLSGNLTLAIGAGATLILEKSAAAGAAAAFSGSTGTLQLGDAQDYRGSIAGFAGGTTLDLRSIGFGAGTTTTLGYSGTTSSGTLTVSDGTRTANLSMIGSYTKASFALAGDSHGGSAITLA